MPPENELKFRVVFIYSDEDFEMDEAKYWRKFGKKEPDGTLYRQEKGTRSRGIADRVSEWHTRSAAAKDLYADGAIAQVVL
jgi:hypothetical protein